MTQSISHMISTLEKTGFLHVWMLMNALVGFRACIQGKNLHAHRRWCFCSGVCYNLFYALVVKIYKMYLLVMFLHVNRFFQFSLRWFCLLRTWLRNNSADDLSCHCNLGIWRKTSVINSHDAAGLYVMHTLVLEGNYNLHIPHVASLVEFSKIGDANSSHFFPLYTSQACESGVFGASPLIVAFFCLQLASPHDWIWIACSRSVGTYVRASQWMCRCSLMMQRWWTVSIKWRQNTATVKVNQKSEELYFF